MPDKRSLDDKGRLLDALDSVEAQLDPGPRRRGRIVADLVTALVLAPIAIALDWHATRPLLLLGLMVTGLLANRAIPLLTERTLRKRRATLYEALGGNGDRAEDDRSLEGPESHD